MKIERKFTTQGTDVYSLVDWTTRQSKITNLDGSTVFQMDDAEVPASWSQLATDIMVSKYFRKAGVPQPEAGLDPIKAQREGKLQRDDEGNAVTGPERSVKQVVHRLAGCWRAWGDSQGYFDTDEDGQAFYDELAYMMLTQMAAPNSPQWFNTGLNWAYGINGPAQGHWYTDPVKGETTQSEDAYTHPQPHACFIQSIDDDLVGDGGIMDLWVREARLFKYGSGTGTNFSHIRGENEPLSGGGKSSGLMSFLKIGDRAAGAIKSGGTTRRAAKMVCLDLDHPDIEAFTNWKVREEIKVEAMVEGLKQLSDKEQQTARELDLNLGYDFNNESYQTVSGQNSNNSVRIPNRFFEALDEDAQWPLIRRTDGEVAKTIPAKHLWDEIGYAAWRCADPGVQYDGTINEWHTCPQSGRINASNPCSEYMFLDNTACNLASVNVLKFYDAEARHFDVDAYEHAIRLWTIVLEISVLMAQYPSKEIARLSHDFRTLGLGYANLGAMLMQAGIPYDSERARAISGCVSAVLTGRSYATSAEMAGELGPFNGYYKNREPMHRVMRNHRRAAYGVPRDPADANQHDLGGYENLSIAPVPIDGDRLTQGESHVGALSNSGELANRACSAWDDAVHKGEQYGYRNAQTTVIAPTGTIGLLMDCDTTGVEPDFALVKFKKLAGGGYFKIANASLKPALKSLGYDQQQVKDIVAHVLGHLHLDVPMPAKDGGERPATEAETFGEWLAEKGFEDGDLQTLTDALPRIFELNNAFNPWMLGQELFDRLGYGAQAGDPSFNLLRALGLTKKQIARLNELTCGTQTVEGAPHLTDEHLPVFDCAATCGPKGERYIAPEGHIRMMAAAQPFISGAISKTINLPNSASVDDIKGAYRLSWELGLKANALYRDGCKLSQPLSNKTDEEDIDEQEDDQAELAAAHSEVRDEVVEVAQHAGVSPEKVKEPVEKIVERIVERPLRRRLPDTRQSRTHKFNVAGHEGYLTVGLYEDGTPGELFITMAKEGSTIGGLMDSLGTAISVALQYGVPVESLVTKFTHQRFEPAGMTHNPDVPFAKSLVDYIFRWLGMEFVPGYREANAPKRSKPVGDNSASQSDKSPAKDTARRVAATNGETNGQNGKDAATNGQGSDSNPSTVRSDRSIVDEPRRGQSEGFSASADETSNGAGQKAKQANGDAAEADTLTAAMKDMQSDAPACDVCGTITVRNGTCYKCMNCGNSMGCS
jgi:ribonucleoside-diphosphate reductase alpha chain